MLRLGRRRRVPLLAVRSLVFASLSMGPFFRPRRQGEAGSGSRVLSVGLFMMRVIMMLMRMLVIMMVLGMLLKRRMRLVGIMLMLGLLGADMRLAWRLVLLTVESAGLVMRRLPDGENVADCGLKFALHEILHDLRGSLL